MSALCRSTIRWSLKRSKVYGRKQQLPRDPILFSLTCSPALGTGHATVSNISALTKRSFFGAAFVGIFHDMVLPNFHRKDSSARNPRGEAFRNKLWARKNADGLTIGLPHSRHNVPERHSCKSRNHGETAADLPTMPFSARLRGRARRFGVTYR